MGTDREEVLDLAEPISTVPSPLTSLEVVGEIRIEFLREPWLADIEKLEQKVERLMKQVVTATPEGEEFKECISGLLTLLRKSTEEVKCWETSHAILQKQQKEVSTYMESLTSQVSLHITKLKLNQSKSESLLLKESAELKESLSSALIKETTYMDKIQVLTLQRNQLSGQKRCLEIKNAGLETKLRNLHSSRAKKISDANSEEVDALKNTNSILNSKIEMLEMMVAKLESQSTAFRNENELLNEKVKDLDSKLEAQKGELNKTWKLLHGKKAYANFSPHT